ncbi:MAG: DUF4058 family protein [Anaerolineae bacterium]
MPSPFPGMDPYLEHPLVWQDVHISLAGEIRDQLVPQLRPRYVARLTRREIMDEPDAEELRVMMPDVAVVRRPPVEPLPQPGGVAVAIPPAPTTTVNVMAIPFRQVSVEIRDAASGLLVTAIEILSPANKRPGTEAREAYLRKRRNLLASTAHLLEIDLLRQGERLPLDPAPPPASYYIVLSRQERRPEAEVWPIHLQDPLPVVPVPLIPPDPDAPLDLGAALTAIYDRAGYDLDTDYSADPFPPLEGEDAVWAAQLLQESGRVVE